MESKTSAVHREPWNKGNVVGQKAPIWNTDNSRAASRPATAITTIGSAIPLSSLQHG